MTYLADLHIHTTLSPCGDLSMSPDMIISKAREKNLGLIGITDHNTTRQCTVVKALGEKHGIVVIQGAEVTTKEEVHCLVYFDGDEPLKLFQLYLDQHLPDFANDVRFFGYQVAVNENNDIVYTEDRLLINAINQTIEEVEKKVHKLGGLFIPAHIDKTRFSILGQLGFLPQELKVDALEISPYCDEKQLVSRHSGISGHKIIRSSDAHYPHEIGRNYTQFDLRKADFGSIRDFLRKTGPD